jgi:hypothetical protein
MNFHSFKENVKKIALKYKNININFIEFIDNYGFETQIHNNKCKNLESFKLESYESESCDLAKDIIRLIDEPTLVILYKIKNFKEYYECGDLYNLWNIIYIKIAEPIIIIGAGVSGLTIANGINDNPFLILEGRNRIGGRVLTSNKNMDMGAAWIHGSENNPLNKFINYDNMIPVGNCNPWMHSENIQIKYLSNKHSISEKYRQQLAIIWNDIASKIGNLNNDNKTIYEAYNNLINNNYYDNYYDNKYFSEEKDFDKDIIDKNEIFRKDIESFLYMIEVWCGGSIKNIPSSFLNENNYNKALFGDYGGSHYLFKNGTKSLIESIVNSNKNNINDKIKYNQIVTNIIYNDYYIEVHTRDEKIYYCNKLCITVPPGPLKNICFNPPLSNKHIESLNKIKMGSYKKIQLEFTNDDIFWDSIDNVPMILTYNSCDSNDNKDNKKLCSYILWNNYKYLKNKPILEAICPAEVGWSLSGIKDEEIIDDVLIELKKYYPFICDPIS